VVRLEERVIRYLLTLQQEKTTSKKEN
jgi:hypothetical protein